MAVKLTSTLVEGFAGIFLSGMYDNPAPTPDLHRQCWELYCTDVPLAAVAAPREHAKSTALTHDFGLATVLFRVQDYVVIVSATEDLAINHLGDIAKELRENDELIAEFKVRRLLVDAKTDVIVEFQDGHQARFIAKGSGQKMRGLKWNGKRPGLILCDDLEEDEQVENRDRRTKFRRWFFRALLPCRRRGGQVRMHGTIIHEDSLLARVMKASSWSTLLFKAHDSFDEFSNILWPEQFPPERLRAIRQAFIDDGDAAGYSQEYLNDPLDNSEAYLRKDDFLPMKGEDHDLPKKFLVGCDFAVSKKDKANRTSFTVGGKDFRNIIHIVDQHVERWDTEEWMEEMFSIDSKWSPDAFIVEDGVIWKAVAPTLYKEMQKRDQWLNCLAINPTSDKATRGRPFQKHHKSGGMRYDKEAEWYPAFENELLKFTGNSDATLDDQFDSTAILVKGSDQLSTLDEDDFETEVEEEMRRSDPRLFAGRSATTGY